MQSETDEAALNRSYFLALRTVAARDTAEACAKYGVDVQFSEQVAKLTMADIEWLALSGIVVFKPIIDPQQFLRIAAIEDPAHRHILARLVPNTPEVRTK